MNAKQTYARDGQGNRQKRGTFVKTAEGVTEKRTSILRRIWRIILVITIPLTALSVVCLVLLNMIYTRYDRSVQNITAVNSYNLD